MKREWKPGDVGLWEHLDATAIALQVAECPNDRHTDGPHWHTDNGGWVARDEHVRPLVVLDEQNSDQVEQLAALLWPHYAENERARLRKTDIVRAALRSLVEPPKPPRPEEPTGLGAVVEDARGHKFVRVAVAFDGWMHGKQWQRIGGEINAVRNFGWLDLDVVRVLSEGVTE